jgi:predicted 3-demethylubiquinone-9 3-methyltransferase (glyoxalase superfamily)
MKTKQKITTFLWYDGRAEEAARLYVSIFKKDAKVHSVSPMSVTFRLAGQEFIALNGGPQYKFTPAVSLFVSCKDQREVDYFWKRLVAGGEPSRCGWLVDRFGLSWQIVPTMLGDTIFGKDRAGAQRAIAAMLKMQKLDVKALRKAYRGR